MKSISHLLILFCLLLHLKAQCQITLYNNSELLISDNTIFTGVNIINANTIHNEGELIVNGNWNNTGTYNSNNGSLTFNSADQQTITDNNGIFNSIFIDGGGDKILNSPISISNTIIFTNGMVISNGQNAIHLSETAQNPTGNNNSHVIGPFYSAINSQQVTFPVGDGFNYLPVSLIELQGNGSEIGFELVSNSVDAGLNDSLVYVSNNRYWQLLSDEIPNAKISLPIFDEIIPSEDDNEKLIIAEGEGIGSAFMTLGGTIQGEFISSENVISQKYFAVGREKLFELIIRNFISKNSDNVNDIIEITNIDKFPNAEILFINQLGIEVLSMRFDNFNAETFNTLNKGNYICIVREGGTELARDVITIVN